ncbi:hypothetical protein PR002_g7421 [Phytophthora rubi]|uniref:Uncharacterized protein n=1 Tax=Phytophthora rubi TaxID=129364 RepID=A0A6A3MWK0_9STRA|nr:hypothetical protein PR002_g7421 [Phytophthora rubi]
MRGGGLHFLRGEEAELEYYANGRLLLELPWNNLLCGEKLRLTVCTGQVIAKRPARRNLARSASPVIDDVPSDGAAIPGSVSVDQRTARYSKHGIGNDDEHEEVSYLPKSVTR